MARLARWKPSYKETCLRSHDSILLRQGLAEPAQPIEPHLLVFPRFLVVLEPEAVGDRALLHSRYTVSAGKTSGWSRRRSRAMAEDGDRRAADEGSSMGAATIYFFTGTGNSLAVARELAGRIKASLVPVTSTFQQERVETDAEVIGFVFPIYDFGAPRIVEALVGKLSSFDSKYVFAVRTYGIGAGRSMVRFAKTVETHGGALSGGFGVAMPHNGVGCRFAGRSERKRLLRAWTGRAQTIAAYIEVRRTAPWNRAGHSWRCFVRGSSARFRSSLGSRFGSSSVGPSHRHSRQATTATAAGSAPRSVRLATSRWPTSDRGGTNAASTASPACTGVRSVRSA